MIFEFPKLYTAAEIPHGFELDLEALSYRPPTSIYAESAASFGFTTPEELIKHLLFNTVTLPVMDRGVEVPVKWIPAGRLCGGASGPQGKVSVMVIGKMPGPDEVNAERNFVGRSGELIREVADEVGLDIRDWYCANAVRFLPPDGGKTLRPHHVKDCAVLLAQDIAAVKPDYLLLVGGDAVKCVFGTKTKLTDTRSMLTMLDGVAGLGHPPQRSDDFSGVNPIHVLATTHPAAVLREPSLREGFVADMHIFKALLEKRDPVSSVPLNYMVLTKPDEVRGLVDWLFANGMYNIAIDCEWGGRSFLDGALRTIQLSWGVGQAAVIALMFAEEVPAQSGKDVEFIKNELRRLFDHPDVKLIGHNIRADAKWIGDRITNIMRPGKVIFDTMLADHILNENAEHDLGSCAVRYCGMGRYDRQLQDWVSANGGRKMVKQRGYLDVPDDVLHFYAAADADAAWRLWGVLSQTLERPGNEHVRRCYYEIVLPCIIPINEVETVGLLVDRDRMTSLVSRYDLKRAEMIELLRAKLGNPSFNPESVLQVRELLFSSGSEGGLGLTPLKSTGKPARMWEDVLSLPPEEIKRYVPSTDYETVEHLFAEHDNPVLQVLRDYKVVSQICSTFLRPPDSISEDGEEVYTSGLVHKIDMDGRIRTDINQMSETGRWKSSNPNCQNFPKRRDKSTREIMGKDIPSIRSCFVAGKGNIIVEADYRSAEIFTLGYLSNCRKLIRDAETDLHARGAVTRMGAPKWDGFDAGKAPDKDWLSKHKALRIASKTISFGIPYQRGAKAIAREIEKSTEGRVPCDIKKAQMFVDGFYDDYPETHEYVTYCKGCVTRPGWIENPFGRRRRASLRYNDDNAQKAALERELVNFPIQSTVADILNIAIYKLWEYRRLYPGQVEYKILLAVHDAIMLEVPGRFVRRVVHEVLPQCMRVGAVAPTWHWTVVDKDSMRAVNTLPFTLDIDIELGLRWGESATVEQLHERNVDDCVINEFCKT